MSFFCRISSEEGASSLSRLAFWWVWGLLRDSYTRAQTELEFLFPLPQVLSPGAVAARFDAERKTGMLGRVLFSSPRVHRVRLMRSGKLVCWSVFVFITQGAASGSSALVVHVLDVCDRLSFYCSGRYCTILITLVTFLMNIKAILT